MVSRKPVLLLLCLTVLAPIVLYTDRLATFSNSVWKNDFEEEISNPNVRNEPARLNAVHQELSDALREPIGLIFSDNSSNLISANGLAGTNIGEHKSRVLSAAEEGVIKSVTEKENHFDDFQKPQLEDGKREDATKKTKNSTPTLGEPIKKNDRINKLAAKTELQNHQSAITDKQTAKPTTSDAMVRQLKDQLIRARVYQGLASTRSNPHLIRELRVRVRELQRALGEATKDSELSKNAHEKSRALEQVLVKGRQSQDDCSAIVKKLRAMLQSTEEQLRAHRKQAMFLNQLAAKALPKGLHCLPLRLSIEFYSLDPSQQNFPNQEKLENPDLYHYALFSDNILAAAVVVNSTVVNAKNSGDHVFHIVTDRLNYAAMKMWFLANPPKNATIQIQSVEEFTWLNASYSPVLKQLHSQNMIDYYFKTHRGNSDPNLKYRNPKYLSILNHLRFYLPEIFPKLQKVVFLDDDIVVQKDLTKLWAIDMKGKVNGAVETCGESFHRFDRYLNFSNPMIAKNFDPRACGWAYGMNVFDLAEWRKQNITEIYHYWQRLNQDRTMWKLGTLPPGLITFWKRTFTLDRFWHVLGLGYNPNVNQRDIERAAVIHFNGNLKPWLEIVIPKYRNYWFKYVDFDQVYLRECNITP
ncbi:probable galacturonosyltransferase 4 [Phalaenopsis equestris]|uniref:probable galacturonosyltransferase 4 n=1 Tax=Phalaenopsis equestris TaxID=78828 RepID=UPI0009E38C0B|nr:probable galacturonosyltransferase 4 [Phalaenopsis equestris]XP_020584305.1 probable galacturonosyltransferase 4 [Phalaenopsis equestris]